MHERAHYLLRYRTRSTMWLIVGSCQINSLRSHSFVRSIACENFHCLQNFPPMGTPIGVLFALKMLLLDIDHGVNIFACLLNKVL